LFPYIEHYGAACRLVIVKAAGSIVSLTSAAAQLEGKQHV
jgi:hypothetical protein